MNHRRILMVAFHFPPLIGSSGLQRTLAFSRYLLEDHKWEPIVLTASKVAYPSVSDHQMGDIADGVQVVRAPAFDAARHFAVRGRYPLIAALPDRWASWWPGGVLQGLRVIKRCRPRAIWSTYPIATAHKIALTLSRITGLPWIADFRDSMTEDDYPKIQVVWNSYRKIEALTVSHASELVFTTNGARHMYAERYPEIDPQRFNVIENGYDEAIFSTVVHTAVAGRSDPMRMLHSGLLSPSERSPRAFFDALAQLKRSGEVSSESLRVTLRASGNDSSHIAEIDSYDIADLVDVAPSISYREALKEMIGSDVLLIFQAANCNHQIPAKLYEYFRTGRPVLAMTDPGGDTAALVYQSGLGDVVSIDSPKEIMEAIRKLMASGREGEQKFESSSVAQYSRQARAVQLADLLDRVTSAT